MPKAADSSTTSTAIRSAPLADHVELAGYDFRQFTLQLQLDGWLVGRVSMNREQATKMALQILSLQMLPGPDFSEAHGDAVKQIAALIDAARKVEATELDAA